MKALLSLQFAILLTLIMAAFMLVASTFPLRAATTQCVGLADLLATLDQKYGEAVIWTGITDAALLVITANPDGSTWTAFVQRPDDMACVFAHGQQWLPGSAPAPPLLGQEG